MTRKSIGKQLSYLRRDLEAMDGKLSLGEDLTVRQTERLNTIRTKKYMHDNRTHKVPDRIVSVNQPFVCPIVRGKAGKPKVVNLKKHYSEFFGIKMKLWQKGNKWVIKSHMCNKAVEKAKSTLKDKVKKLQKSPTPKSVNEFNAAVLRLHNYFIWQPTSTLTLTELPLRSTRA